MNTERRHELESNALAQGLTTWSDKLRPYASLMLGVLAALLAVYIVATMWNSYQARREAAAWHEYELALFQGDGEARALQRLANSEEHQGTEMQEWAYMSWADRQLRLAAELYLRDREDAKKRLESVQGVYEQFADKASSTELKNRARLGLARVSEMQGDLAAAKAQYALVEGALAALAEERIEQLESKSAADTVQWLATVELPKRATPTGPGTPGQRPGFEAAPPNADEQGGLNFDTTQSLEEILGGIRSDEAANPYGEAGAPGAADAPAGADQSMTDADGASSSAPAIDAKPAIPAAESPSEESIPGQSGTPLGNSDDAEKPAEQ
jgi:hypothetical protein